MKRQENDKQNMRGKVTSSVFKKVTHVPNHVPRVNVMLASPFTIWETR